MQKDGVAERQLLWQRQRVGGGLIVKIKPSQ
jgi:hypothetical protein